MGQLGLENPETLATLAKTSHRTKTNKAKTIHRKLKR
jgi:hypothetical protein